MLEKVDPHRGIPYAPEDRPQNLLTACIVRRRKEPDKRSEKSRASGTQKYISGQPDLSGVTKLLFTRMWHRQTGLPAGTENAASPFPASPDVQELTRYPSCRNVITFLQEYGTLSAKKQNASALCFFARESLHLRMHVRYADTAENSRLTRWFHGSAADPEQ